MNDIDIEGGALDLTPAPKIDWNQQRIELLVTLWTEGHSTNEIARRMAISKNAVVGKAHRLRLKPRPSPLKAGTTIFTQGLTDPQMRAYAVLRRKCVLPADARAQVLRK